MEIGLSSALTVPVFDFRYIALLQSQSASKATAVESRTFWPPVKIMVGMGEMFESIFYTLPITQPLIYFWVTGSGSAV